jgi:hypothetical protein
VDNDRYTAEERRLRMHLGALIGRIRLFESQVDVLFHPESRVKGEARGKELAKHLNDLSFHTDYNLRFGLDFDLPKHKAYDINAISKWSRKTKRVEPATNSKRKGESK